MFQSTKVYGFLFVHCLGFIISFDIEIVRVHVENPIPKRIKAARKESNYTQIELGLLIGSVNERASSSRISQYESGKNLVDVVVAGELAKALNKPVHYFFCPSDLDAELVCLIDQLATREKEKLVKHIKSLLTK